jgi:hypothetical protein
VRLNQRDIIVIRLSWDLLLAGSLGWLTIDSRGKLRRLLCFVLWALKDIV